MTEHRQYDTMSRDELLEEIRLVQRVLGSAGSLPTLVNELQVHREEVRVQQGLLIDSHRELEESRDRYADLYDFAPIGFVTLDRFGTVREANLAAAALLRIERERLIGTPLLLQVHDADRGAFLDHLGRCRATTGARTTSVTVRLRPSPSAHVLVSLVCRTAPGPSGELLLQTGSST